MRLTWPLVGREREMRLIETSLSAPHTRGIVISGPAGVGKSRVAAEALDAAAARGSATRWVVGTSAGRGLPLGAMAEWADPAVAHGLQLVCGVIESMTAAAKAGPVVIGVDDAHLLDDMSMFVLQQIAQRGIAKMVLTLRDGESVPDGATELFKSSLFDWLELPPLDREDTTSLLTRSLEGPLDVDTAARLYALTRGNVLYLRHIVEQEVAEGRLESHGGQWRWAGGLSVPHTLMELIDSRIGALPPEVATVIDVLAIGEPIELAALQRITEPKAIEDADVLGLILVEDTGVTIDVRLAHPLYGEVRRSRAAPTRLRRLRGAVATELAAAHNRDDARVLVRRAALSLDSDLDLDADVLIRAARGAICIADLPLANRLAEAASRVSPRAEAKFIQAHALSWMGCGESAEEVLSSVHADQLQDEDFARFTFFRASNMLWALAEPDRAADIIGAATRLTDGLARRCMDAIRAVHSFATDRPEMALEVAQDLALGDLPPVIAAEAAWVLANIHGDAGALSAAEDIADAGIRIVRSSEAPHMRFNIADARVGALLLSGRVEDADVLAASECRHAADLPGTAHLLGIAIAGRGALGAGRLTAAAAMLQQSSAALAASGHAIGWGYRYRISAAVALAISGKIEEAAKLLTSLQNLRRPFRALNIEFGLAHAWVAAGQGAVSEGIRILNRSAQTAAAHGQYAAEVMCLQTATQFGDRTHGPRLRELAALVEGPRASLAGRFADALAAGDAAELAAVSEEFEKLGDLVAALDAAAHAAVAYRRDDLRGSAYGSASRADELAIRCGGAQTPALAWAGSKLPLTEREREVAILVGHGLLNREIAAKLVVSTRTVEGHVYKAMQKTGVSTREELAALMKPLPPAAD
ncbi:LuxR C-terminal-related transcriptional regulator [Mycolicibacterium sp. BiH015]|uniref:helix-turn-helix transcriptional regulator n=1 Tax=Mycolicibacterium sp. BiH015 TaxID=3018808 RepID=UPI0022E2A1D6|nr:LuxR family transcriptional regulator [Mycolicibacterium sp. BiH015]MDA2891160.1 LuxR C-terminal-related transcriptional regulator [Mycolicibacterium sp. BiH015]